jgi:hypothetical protein
VCFGLLCFLGSEEEKKKKKKKGKKEKKRKLPSGEWRSH